MAVTQLRDIGKVVGIIIGVQAPLIKGPSRDFRPLTRIADSTHRTTLLILLMPAPEGWISHALDARSVTTSHSPYRAPQRPVTPA
jgi:hypothetical protein